MTPMDASYNYNDLAGLHNITKRSNENEAEALKEVARQFESMFVKMMLKSMRDANAEFEKDSLFNSYETKFYRQMFDDQLALSLSQGKGIGLAETIYRQLSRQFDVESEDTKPDQWMPIRGFKGTSSFNESPVEGDQDAPGDSESLALTMNLTSGIKTKESPNVVNLFGEHKQSSELANKPILPAGIAMDSVASEVSAAEKKALNANLSPVTSSTIQGQVEVNRHDILKQSKPALTVVKNEKSPANNYTSTAITKQSAFKSPEEFVETLWPIAQQVGKAMGVEPKAIMAQAALETGWGKYIIHQADGKNSFNLFGIKADHRWSGEQARVSTLEYRNGIAKKEVAPFRAYESYEHSLRDYSEFITTSSRYEQAVKNGTSIKAYSNGLQSGGYATDPNYADKIQRIAGGEVLNNAIKLAERQTHRG